jgi:spore coat protein SA
MIANGAPTKSIDGKMPVAVLLSGREKFSPYFGGALARWTYEVYRHLQDKIDIKVYGFPTAPEETYPLAHETTQAWRLCWLAGRAPYVRRYEDWFWLRSLKLRLGHFDVVHIHNRPQWAPMLRKFGYRGTIIVHLQNDHLGHWTTPMLDTLSSNLDAVATCSTYLKNTFAQRSSRIAAKSHVISNGVDPEVFFPRENVRESKTIFFVGRLDPEKGIFQLMQAYALVLKNHPEAKLVIGGATGFGTNLPTPYHGQLQQLARSIQQNHGAQIDFTGYLHHDRELPLWFQKATIFACPSLFQEPFGLVNTEAMACATPVVGSNRGGIPEVLNDTGVLVDPENISEFANALSDLLTDTKRRQLLGEAGYRRAIENYDWKLIAESWYQRIIQTVEQRARTAVKQEF